MHLLLFLWAGFSSVDNHLFMIHLGCEAAPESATTGEMEDLGKSVDGLLHLPRSSTGWSQIVKYGCILLDAFGYRTQNFCKINSECYLGSQCIFLFLCFKRLYLDISCSRIKQLLLRCIALDQRNRGIFLALTCNFSEGVSFTSSGIAMTVVTLSV